MERRRMRLALLVEPMGFVAHILGRSIHDMWLVLQMEHRISLPLRVSLGPGERFRWDSMGCRVDGKWSDHPSFYLEKKHLGRNVNICHMYSLTLAQEGSKADVGLKDFTRFVWPPTKSNEESQVDPFVSNLKKVPILLIYHFCRSLALGMGHRKDGSPWWAELTVPVFHIWDRNIPDRS